MGRRGSQPGAEPGAIGPDGVPTVDVIFGASVFTLGTVAIPRGKFCAPAPGPAASKTPEKEGWLLCPGGFCKGGMLETAEGAREDG